MFYLVVHILIIIFCFSHVRVVGTEERIPIPLMDYILNVVSVDPLAGLAMI